MEQRTEGPTPSEAARRRVLKEQKDQAEQTIQEVLGPFEDEADRIRANTLEGHFSQEEASVESSRQEQIRKLRTERRATEPLIVRNPRNKPRP